MKNKFTISLIQMQMSEAPKENLATAVGKIKEAVSLGAEVICLPELFRSPYFCWCEKSAVDYCEPLQGELIETLSSVAKVNEVAVVAGSVYELDTKTNGTRYNTSLVFDTDGSLLGKYRKTHIPHDPGFYEQNYFVGSEENYQVFTLHLKDGEMKVAPLICYDQWFPEAARSVALKGADVIFYPTAIGLPKTSTEKEGKWQTAWTTVQRGHAIANSVVVAAVNRVGVENGCYFWGGSFVSDAFGTILQQGGDKEEIIIAEIDLEHSRYVRDSWRFMKERRPDTYQELVKNTVR